MMASLEKPKVFIITYDAGNTQQTLTVSKSEFDKHEEFRKNIIVMKCLACNFESKFTEDNT